MDQKKRGKGGVIITHNPDTLKSEPVRNTPPELVLPPGRFEGLLALFALRLAASVIMLFVHAGSIK